MEWATRFAYRQSKWSWKWNPHHIKRFLISACHCLVLGIKASFSDFSVKVHFYLLTEHESAPCKYRKIHSVDFQATARESDKALILINTLKMRMTLHLTHEVVSIYAAFHEFFSTKVKQAESWKRFLLLDLQWNNLEWNDRKLSEVMTLMIRNCGVILLASEKMRDLGGRKCIASQWISHVNCL